MANTIINLGALLAPFAMELSSAAKSAESGPQTVVEIGAGIGPKGDTGSFGGNTPAIALFNAQGGRLGQYTPGKNDKIAAGTTSKPIYIPANQGNNGQPEYVQLTTMYDDAICINYVTVSGNGASWTWMGDVAYTCGGDWFPSVSKYGSDNYQPRCAWIDSDHSDKLRFIAMSMHMPDFNSDKGLIDEYNKNNDNLCNSKARFMEWGQLTVNPGQNSIPPMFKPPLQYNADGSDKDINAIFKPGHVRQKRDEEFAAGNHTINMDGSIMRPGHVVISDHKAHNATEVCESDTSRGPSFVSTEEGVYCDMSTKTAYPICEDENSRGCFDVEKKELVAKAARRHAKDIQAREVHKRYETHERWTPEN